MVAGLATATLLGFILGYRHRLAALVLVLVVMVAGGIVSGLSLVQIGASVLMIQIGYAVCSFVRIGLMERTQISAQRARGSEDNPAAGHAGVQDRYR
jgi:hypothetical protein